MQMYYLVNGYRLTTPTHPSIKKKKELKIHEMDAAKTCFQQNIKSKF